MDLTDKGLRDAFTKTGYGAFKALYPVQTEDKVHGLSVDFSLLNVCKPAQTLRFVV